MGLRIKYQWMSFSVDEEEIVPIITRKSYRRVTLGDRLRDIGCSRM